MRSLLSRSNCQYLWRALKHVWGNNMCYNLVKGDAIDERQGHSNAPDPLRLKDERQTES